MKTILIVDDNQADIKLIEELIQDRPIKYSIESAGSGEEGVRRAEELQPSLILLDMRMPGMDGLEACREIRKKIGSKTKIVMMTGKIDALNKNNAKEAGADDLCVKFAEPLLMTILKYVEIEGHGQ